MVGSSNGLGHLAFNERIGFRLPYRLLLKPKTMKLTVIWKSTSPSGYPAKHYVLRKDSQGAEAYLHWVRILVPNQGANISPNTIKTFKSYALIEYWDYYTMITWATIVEAISKIQQYGRNH